MQSTKSSNAENNSADKKNTYLIVNKKKRNENYNSIFKFRVQATQSPCLLLQLGGRLHMEEERGWTQKQVMVHFIFIYQNWRTLDPYDATRINSNFYKSAAKTKTKFDI